MFDQQWVKDRQATLMAEAEQGRLARMQPAKEPLVRFRMTIELQLGSRRLKTADR